MILVESYGGNTVAESDVEVVERKGKGHPDTLCDGVMEAISLALCRAYQDAFGSVLHHNIDKSLLAAGSVERYFGGGRVLRPMELFIGDRAQFGIHGQEIPVEEIAISAAKEHLGRQLRFLDPHRHVVCHCLLSPGSAELVGIFDRPGSVMAANDTSAAVGYAPLTSTETAVLALERFLNSPHFKERYPYTGEDVKVMGIRRHEQLEVTVAMPLLASFLSSETDYFACREEIIQAIDDWLYASVRFAETRVYFNHLDRPGRGEAGAYLSLLGTSAEDADSGQVGRGNRVNGLISINRPLGTEAAAGKNPVSHVGKIYNVLTHHLADRIFRQVEGVREVYVIMASRIGEPIDQPALVSVRLSLMTGISLGDVSPAVNAIVEEEIEGIDQFCGRLIDGLLPVCGE